MRRATVELDEGRAAALRQAIEGDSRMVGVLQDLHGKRIVGVTIEEPEPEPEADAEAEPTKRKPRK